MIPPVDAVGLKHMLRAIRHELRLVGLSERPGPRLRPICDVEAEAEVISAVLDGRVTTGELAPLRENHFYSLFYGAVWRAAETAAPGDVVAVRAALVAAGWRGELDTELFTALYGQPFALLPRLRALAGRIVELSTCRDLVENLQRIAFELSIGVLDASGARARLAHCTDGRK